MENIPCPNQHIILPQHMSYPVLESQLHFPIPPVNSSELPHLRLNCGSLIHNLFHNILNVMIHVERQYLRLSAALETEQFHSAGQLRFQKSLQHFLNQRFQAVIIIFEKQLYLCDS